MKMLDFRGQKLCFQLRPAPVACIVYLWSLGVLKAGSDGFRGGSNGVGGERKKKRGGKKMIVSCLFL